VIFEITEEIFLLQKKISPRRIPKFKVKKIPRKKDFKRKILCWGNQVPEGHSRGNSPKPVETKHVFHERTGEIKFSLSL